MHKNLLLNLAGVAGLSLMCGCGQMSQEQSVPKSEASATEQDASQNEEQKVAAVEALAEMPENQEEANEVAQNLEEALQQEVQEQEVVVEKA